MTKYRKQEGSRAEELALQYLQDQGLEPRDQNFQIWGGEIDLIMADFRFKEEELVFVEVKSRKDFSEVPLEELISQSKLHFLTKTAEFWMQDNKYGDDTDWRIDVVGVNLVSGEVDWLKDVMG